MSIARPRVGTRLPSCDIVVVDSLYAWTLLAALRRRPRPLAVAMAHQQPGGVDVSRLRHAVLRHADGAVYRSCDLVVAPGPSIAELLIDTYGVDASRGAGDRARLRSADP